MFVKNWLGLQKSGNTGKYLGDSQWNHEIFNLPVYIFETDKYL